jgi:hypothetical protein
MTAPRARWVAAVVLLAAAAARAGEPPDAGVADQAAPDLAGADAAGADLAGGGVTLVASQLASPWEIALDRDNIYWLESPPAPPGHAAESRVASAAKDGGAPTVIFRAPVLVALAGDGDDVYFASDGGGASSPSGALYHYRAGMSAPVAVATGLGKVRGLSVDATGAYFTDEQAGGGFAARTLKHVPAGGGAPVIFASGPLFLTAVDSASVYVTAGVVADAGYLAQDTVYALPKGGGASALLASHQVGVVGLATDGRALYFSLFAHAGAILDVPLAGGAVGTVAPAQDEPSALVAGPTGVYWTNRGAGTLTRLGPGDAAPTALASPPMATGACALAIDSDWVYVTLCTPAGAILRAPL